MIYYRTAQPSDAEALARLHAQSWQQHYRGILRDDYLDREVQHDRQLIWRARLLHPKATQHIIVANDGDCLVGFACLYAHHDPVWGTLLDNLHVAANQQGRGIGRALMAMSAQWVQQFEGEKMHLWVYKENTAACSFYERVGGVRQDKVVVDNPGGGQASVFRYVWSDLSTFIH